MSELPKRINVSELSPGWHMAVTPEFAGATPYIRADILDRLAEAASAAAGCIEGRVECDMATPPERRTLKLLDAALAEAERAMKGTE